MKNNPLISIVIAARNEEKYIGRCLDSLINQDYPKESMEIFVVDGGSSDRTREIVAGYNQKYSFVRLLDNPRKVTPYAFNIGIRNSKGEFVIIISAHGSAKQDYLSICLKRIEEYGADIVGGVVKTLPAKNTLGAKSVALAFSHSFGSGNAYYRTGVLKEAREVDAVDSPCFRKSIFEKVGLFNEKLTRSQDMEFNLRVKRAGGKIILCPDIISYYYPKSTLKEFFFHNIEDGIWAVYPLKLGEETLASRHYVPLFFVGGLLLFLFLGFFIDFFNQLFLFLFGFYILVSLFFSIKIALKQKDIRLAFFMLIAFGARHFGYGFGSFWGLLTIWRLKAE